MSTSTETYRELRLQGFPDDEPPFDATVRDEGFRRLMIAMFRKIQSGEYEWQDARLTTRVVTVTRDESEWVEVEPCEYAHSHTGAWCGNPLCRES